MASNIATITNATTTNVTMRLTSATSFPRRAELVSPAGLGNGVKCEVLQGLAQRPRTPLLETVWKSGIGLEGVASGQNRAKISHLALLKHETQAIKNPPAIFQTVSLGTRVNRAVSNAPRFESVTPPVENPSCEQAREQSKKVLVIRETGPSVYFLTTGKLSTQEDFDACWLSGSRRS